MGLHAPFRGVCAAALTLLLATTAWGEVTDPAARRFVEELRAALPAGASLTVETGRGDPYNAGGAFEKLVISLDPPRVLPGWLEPLVKALPEPRPGGVRAIEIDRIVASKLGTAGAGQPAPTAEIALDGLRYRYATPETTEVATARFAGVTLQGALGLDARPIEVLRTLDTGPWSWTGVRHADPRPGGGAVLVQSVKAGPTVSGIATDVVVEGWSQSMDEGVFEIARTTMKQVDLRGLPDVLPLMTKLVAAPEGQPPSFGEALRLIELVAAMVPAYESTGITTRLLEPADARFTVRRAFHLVPEQWRAGTGRFGLGYEGFKLEGLPLPDEIAGPLMALGLDPLGFSLTAEGTWTAAERRLALAPVRLAIDRAAVLELSGDLGSLPSEAALAGAGEDHIADLLAATPLRSLSLAIEDAGALPRILDLLAETQQMDRSTLAAAARVAVNDILKQTGGGVPAAKLKAILDAVEGFIRKPGRLVIAYRPREPRALATLAETAQQRPGQVLGELDVTYTAPR